MKRFIILSMYLCGVLTCFAQVSIKDAVTKKADEALRQRREQSPQQVPQSKQQPQQPFKTQPRQNPQPQAQQSPRQQAKQQKKEEIKGTVTFALDNPEADRLYCDQKFSEAAANVAKDDPATAQKMLLYARQNNTCKYTTSNPIVKSALKKVGYKPLPKEDKTSTQDTTYQNEVKKQSASNKTTKALNSKGVNGNPNKSQRKKSNVSQRTNKEVQN